MSQAINGIPKFVKDHMTANKGIGYGHKYINNAYAKTEHIGVATHVCPTRTAQVDNTLIQQYQNVSVCQVFNGMARCVYSA